MWAVDRLTPTLHALNAAWSARQENLWLGLVAVPLAETASGLLGLWWMWVVLLFVAQACMRSWRWFWLLSLELGFVGATWAEIGIIALVRWPEYRLVVEAIWAILPVPLVVVGAYNRERYRRPEAYFPLR
jgi:hypothetical protein